MAETNQQTNPYLALMQQEEQAPSTAQLLRMFANLVGGASAGIGQTGTWGGIAPGLFMGINANAQDADQAERRRLRQAEIGIQASKWDEERKQRQAEQGAMGGLRGLLTAPGVTAPQPSPYQLGPSAAGGPAPNQEAFVQMMMPHALEVSKQTGLDPRLVIAQTALETGYGRAAPGNNYFGIKSHGQPGGQVLPTNEVGPAGEQYTLNQSFRTYGDPGASAADYANFMKTNSRYAPVLSAQGLDAQIEALGKSGYATDPNYAAKLRQIAGRIPGGPQVAQVGGGGPVTGGPVTGGPTTAGGSPYDPNAQAPPFMGGPAPSAPGPLPQGAGEGDVAPLQYALPPPSPSAAPAPGDPNVVRTGGPQPQAPAGRPPPDMPPKIPAPSVQQLSPEAKQRLAILSSLPNIKPIQFAQELNKEINAEWQESQKQAVEGWQRQWKNYDRDEGRSYEAHLKEQAKRDAAVLAKTKREQEQADKERDRAQGRKDKGQWVTNDQGQEVWMSEEQITPGTVKHPKPASPQEQQAAALADRKAGTAETQAKREDENKLRDDMNAIKQVQDFRKADLVFQSAQKAAKVNTPAADLNLVYAFATMMDPGSVVRDQETGMIRATQSASDQVKAYVAMVSGDSRLSPKAKKELLAEMATRHSAYKESHDAFAQAFEDLATRRGLDPANVVMRVIVQKQKEDDPNELPLYDKNGNRITKP